MADGNLRDPCCCISPDFCIAVWHEEFCFQRQELGADGEMANPQMPKSVSDGVMEGGEGFRNCELARSDSSSKNIAPATCSVD